MRLTSPRRWALCAAVFGCLLFQAQARASTSKDIEAKVALESSLEKRLQTVLREVLGSDDLIVIVSVEMLPDSEAAEEILPGILPKTSPTVPGTLGLTLSMVRRVSATVIVDQGISENDFRLVKQTAATILGTSAQRGDALTVEKMKFRKSPPMTPAAFLNSPLGMSALWFIAILAVMILLHLGFLKPLLSLLKEAGVIKGAGPGTGKDKGQDVLEPDALPALNPAAMGQHFGGGARRPDAPFSFLADGDLRGLLFLMRQENPLNIATVLHYAPPALASQALAALAPEIQDQVVALMIHPQELEESFVRNLEVSLRKRIQYLMGGEDRMVEMLDTTPPALQKELLTDLQAQDPDLAQRVNQRLVFLDDLARFDSLDIKALARLVPVRVLASILKADDRLRAQVLPKLSGGILDWMSEEIELSPILPAATLEARQRQAINAVRQLLREGKIDLQKLKPAVPPPANGAPAVKKKRETGLAAEPALMKEKVTEPLPPMEKAEEPAPIIAKAEEPAPIIAKAEEPAPIIAKAEEPAPTIEMAAEPAPIIAKAEEPAPIIARAEEPAPIIVKAEEPAPIIVKVEEPAPIIVKVEEPAPIKKKAAAPSPSTWKAPEPFSPLDMDAELSPFVWKDPEPWSPMEMDTEPSPSIGKGAEHSPPSGHWGDDIPPEPERWEFKE